MRFLGVIFGTLFTFFILLATTYFWGMGQVFPKFENAFFEQKKPWIILPWSFEAEIESDKDLIVWVDVYRSNNHTLMVSPWEEAHLKQHDPVVSRYRPLFSDLLQKHSQRKFIVNILSNVSEIDKQILELTRPQQKAGLILFQSEFDIILRSMKTSVANVPYGSSQSDRLRMQVFENLAPWKAGLLPATPFRGDIYISPLKWRDLQMLSSEIVKELRRRQKNVIVGPISNEAELQRAQGLGADGFYINDANLLKKLKTH